MARTLPWLNDAEAGPLNAQASMRHRHKRQRRPKTPDVHLVGPSASGMSTFRLTEPSFVRKLSSSPPPTPPPSTSPLRSGLQGDDIYIMVEDEFLTTAQIFTKHLHHAEYKAIKRNARLRHAESAKSVSRPVDGVTPMGQQLKQRKRADAVQKRARDGLQGISSRARYPRGDKSDEDSDSDFNVDKMDPQDDAWQGTHLQSFVMTSPQENMKSLIGLGAIKSHTRAAAGFAKIQEDDARRKTKAPSPAVNSDETEDTDDLDEPLVRRERAVGPRYHAQAPSLKQVEAGERVEAPKRTSENNLVAERPPATRILPDSGSSEDDFPRRRISNNRARLASSKLDGASTRRSPPNWQANRHTTISQKAGDGRLINERKLEEIPLFL